MKTAIYDCLGGVSVAGAITMIVLAASGNLPLWAYAPAGAALAAGIGGPIAARKCKAIKQDAQDAIIFNGTTNPLIQNAFAPAGGLPGPKGSIQMAERSSATEYPV
jgi:hypothetical protein